MGAISTCCREQPLEGVPKDAMSAIRAFQKDKKFVVFVSHLKKECGTEARIIKYGLEDLLQVHNGEVFLDSDDVYDLQEVLHRVKESGVLVVLQSSELIQRPWCLLEMHVAVENNIPIVAVNIRGKRYDLVKSQQDLTFLDSTLDRLNPGASDVLKYQGVEVIDVAYTLSNAIPNIISIELDAHESKSVLQNAFQDLLDQILDTAKPVKIDISKEEWLKSRGCNMASDKTQSGHSEMNDSSVVVGSLSGTTSGPKPVRVDPVASTKGLSDAEDVQPKQPSQGISPGHKTLGVADQQERHPSEHVSIPVSGGRSASSNEIGKPPMSYRGGIANWITFFLLVAGLVLQVVVFDEPAKKMNFVLAVGAFGFAGGITNWLAVKMLFDKIPGLYGSGVIPMQYQTIRQTMKTEIMYTFFDEDYLKGYIRQRVPELLSNFNINDEVMNVINAPDFDSEMVAKLNEISATEEGKLLARVKPFMGGSFRGLVPIIKPPLIYVADGIAKELTTTENEADGESVVELIPVDVVRTEIDALMTERLATLTPAVVKELLQNVIRDHLSWLVVWGNIFGSIIGIIALAATGEV